MHFSKSSGSKQTRFIQLVFPERHTARTSWLSSKKVFWSNGTKRRNTNSIEGLVEKQFCGKTGFGGR